MFNLSLQDQNVRTTLHFYSPNTYYSHNITLLILLAHFELPLGPLSKFSRMLKWLARKLDHLEILKINSKLLKN
ncbi:unnamed protein product [Caenorhabditis angaria]|uniref:Uncharacterized protein n=1 Tax=Caenorhabditis angaria TaxID=860376 RepID=A0A9P1N543_9PELO|nr:unnamed protein product [Caenorhabditis angaria]